MLKCKDIVCSDSHGSVLVTLEDGRCACVDTKTRNVFIDILLASFDRFGRYFTTDSFQDKDLVFDILKRPRKVRELGSSQEYLQDTHERAKWDKLKKEFGYNY
ncbi:MAG TPA: hypothetical protein VIG61_06950 [Fusobacterium sp.]|uniref:hypothetical protein n=1 Tax=Fusobacterium sp. TaxID=68766 RepID=UPI002F404152